MFKRMGLLCIVGSFQLIAMDQPGQQLTVEQAKEIVKKYVTNKEGSYIKGTAKDSNYHKHTDDLRGMPSIVALPPVAITLEMGPALTDIFENNGYVCADNKVFVVAYDAEKQSYCVKNYLNLTGKVEQTDVTQPAIASMRVARIRGAQGTRVLLGEINGRLLVADVDNHVINTFGETKGKGKITEIIPHFAGTHLAVKYLQDSSDDPRKKIPCVAACKAFLALQTSQKKTGSYLEAQNKAGNRRSWLPQGFTWSQLVTKQCEKGIDGIRWENDDLLIQCSESKKWERYTVANDALIEIENPLP